jgi:hypothetical protein
MIPQTGPSTRSVDNAGQHERPVGDPRARLLLAFRP